MKKLKHLFLTLTLSLAGWCAMSATPTKMLTKAEAEAITYDWTDAAGSSHSSNLAQTATEPEQIMALIKAVYSNPDVPGPYTAAYNGPSTSSSYTVKHSDYYYSLPTSYSTTAEREVYYGAIGDGWDIGTGVTSTTAYKPNEEGYTVLLVAVKDDYATYSEAHNKYLSSADEIVDYISNTIDSVKVVTGGVRVGKTETKTAGALFNITADLNRFFFMSKGQARDLTYGQERYKTWYNASSYRNSSYPTPGEHFGVMPPFSHMFEQFSPFDSKNDGTGTAADLYESLTNGDTYDVQHDCNSVITQEHVFSVAGTSGTEHYQFTGLNFYLPDYRLEKWLWYSTGNFYANTAQQSASSVYVDGRIMHDDAAEAMAYSSSGSGTWKQDSQSFWYSYDYDNIYLGSWGHYPDDKASALYHYYNPKYYPKMNLYTITLTATVSDEPTRTDSQGNNYYTVTVTWESSLSKLGFEVDENYTLYVVNEDGTYTELTQTTDNSYTYEVKQEEYSQTITYIVKGEPSTEIIEIEAWSNTDYVVIPGYGSKERIVLNLVDYQSKYTTVNERNQYINKLRMSQPTDKDSRLMAGMLKLGDNNFDFYRVDDKGNEVKIATLNLNTTGGAVVPSLSAPTGNINMGSEKTIEVTVKGDNLTQDLTISTTGDFTVSPTTVTAAQANAGYTVTVTYTGSDETATGTLTVTSSEATTNATINYSSGTTPGGGDGDVIASLDFADYASSSGYSDLSLTAPWATTGTRIYEDGSAYIKNGCNITYTVPEGYSNTTITVAITTYNGSNGSGTMIVNNESKSIAKGSTAYWVLTVSTGDVITIKGNGISPDLASIVIYNGDVSSSMKAPRRMSGSITITPSLIYYTNGEDPQNYLYQEAAPTLNFTTRTYSATDTVDLYRIVNGIWDQFYAVTATNEHSSYYRYYVAFESDAYTTASIEAGDTLRSNTVAVPVYKTDIDVFAPYTKAEADADTDHALTAQKTNAEHDVLFKRPNAITRYDVFHTDAPTADTNWATGDKGDNRVTYANHDVTSMGYWPYLLNIADWLQHTFVSYVVNDSQLQGMWTTMVDNDEVVNSDTHYVPVTVADAVINNVTGTTDNTYGAPIEISPLGTIGMNVEYSVTDAKTDGDNTYQARIDQVTVRGTAPSHVTIDGYDYECYMLRAWRIIDEPYVIGEGVQSKKEELLFTVETDGKTCEHTYGKKVWDTSKEGESLDNNYTYYIANGSDVNFIGRFYYRRVLSNDESSNAPRRANSTVSRNTTNTLYYVMQTTANPNEPTGVVELQGNKAAVGVTYYNVQGMQSSTPFEGVNIVVTRYNDGSTTTTKVVK